MKTSRKSASGGQTVKGVGEAHYALELTEDILNPSIRLRYTKGKNPSRVVLSVDGRRQPTIEMVDESTLGDYDVTQEMRLSHALSTGSHSITLEVQSDADALELDYFVIHSKTEHSSR
jgi:hypothetical protein